MTTRPESPGEQFRDAMGFQEATRGYRDKDPPPSYDGADPEKTFQAFEKSVKLWQFETDIPEVKQGAKLLKVLSGTAKLAVEDMEFDEIATENGLQNILKRLREFFRPHLETSMPRAFEQAVYGPARSARESFVEYVARMDRGFTNLRREGVELPSSTGRHRSRRRRTSECRLGPRAAMIGTRSSRACGASTRL